MTAYRFPTRRMLLKDMGKAGLAVMVLGAAACAPESQSNPTTTTGPDQSPTSTAGATPSTPGPAAATSAAPTSTSSATKGWHRVDLDFVSAYIVYRAGEAAIVDTGTAGSASAIEAALGEIGLGWDSVGHVIVTHEHPDHQGGLTAVLEATEEATWHAGAADIGLIEAPTPGSTVADRDIVFDLEIIETPGHTLGHISVYDSAGGVMITGDALNGADGGVTGANPRFTANMDLANDSVRKLAGFDYQVALFGHGEPLLSNASTAVSALADAL